MKQLARLRKATECMKLVAMASAWRQKSRAAPQLPSLHFTIRLATVIAAAAWVLAAVPVALALVATYVTRVAIHISAVAVYVAIFAAQLFPLMRGGPVVAPIQIAAQFPAVMRDLGFVAANVANVRAAVRVVTAQIAVAMVVAILCHHAARACKNQKHQPCQGSFYECSLHVLVSSQEPVFTACQVLTRPGARKFRKEELKMVSPRRCCKKTARSLRYI